MPIFSFSDERQEFRSGWLTIREKADSLPQAQHPDLTLTGIYNVLEKVRSGEALNAKDKIIHDQGLVSVLMQIHDDLDQAVLEAYGWSDLKGSVGVSPASSSSEKECGRDARAPLADILARSGPNAEALEQAILATLKALGHIA